MSKFIQYIGTPEDINKVIKDYVSIDTKLIDLTGDKELENLFNLYSSINPLEENVKNHLESIKDAKAKTYIINDCHTLTFHEIEPLIDLYNEDKVDILLFSNFEPLNLKLPFTKGLSINEPLPYYNYFMVEKKLQEQRENDVFIIDFSTSKESKSIKIEIW